MQLSLYDYDYLKGNSLEKSLTTLLFFTTSDMDRITLLSSFFNAITNTQKFN
jgi:hypothetical protein